MVLILKISLIVGYWGLSSSCCDSGNYTLFFSFQKAGGCDDCNGFNESIIFRNFILTVNNTTVSDDPDEFATHPAGYAVSVSREGGQPIVVSYMEICQRGEVSPTIDITNCFGQYVTPSKCEGALLKKVLPLTCTCNN